MLDFISMVSFGLCMFCLMLAIITATRRDSTLIYSDARGQHSIVIPAGDKAKPLALLLAGAALFAILPFFWIKDWIDAQRRQYFVNRGKCAKCGYDLLATPDPQTQYHLKYSG
jgi:hypothetical protein